jgi:Tol biopolymer transport system component
MRALLCALLLLPALAVAAPAWTPPAARRIAADLHDGDAVAPKLRADGQWIAYGIHEPTKDGFRGRVYARSLGDDGTFRSVWPNQHPSFKGKEGTASFADLLGFAWHPAGRNNAMVVNSKTEGAEVMLELMDLRFGGPGDQKQPVFSRDGTRVAVVAQGDLGRELWVGAVEDKGELEQLTFTRDEERWPDWHPNGQVILHEIRHRQKKTSDLFLFSLEWYDHSFALHLPDSDEVHPTFSPDGETMAFLSNKDDPAGKRFDLFVGAPGGTEFTSLLVGVRFDEEALGYAWDPEGRFLIAAIDDPTRGNPLVAVRADGGAVQDLGFGSQDNLHPDLVRLEEGKTLRLAWTAKNPNAREGADYRVTWLADIDVAALKAALRVK